MKVKSNRDMTVSGKEVFTGDIFEMEGRDLHYCLNRGFVSEVSEETKTKKSTKKTTKKAE